jgi:hypothetical protein
MEPKSPVGQTAPFSVDVPAGKNLNLTEYTVQNPDGDSGVATLVNGTTQLGRWTLADINGDKKYTYVSPIVVKGGTSLVLNVLCIGVGDVGGTGNCTTTMFISGRLVDAPPGG